MVVYVDVLLVVNLIVDFFLLKITFKLLKTDPKPIRVLISSGIGAVSSLYIFFPESTAFINITYQLIIGSLIMLTALGFKSLKYFLRSVAVFFTVTCVYGGIMTALWQVLKPKGMVINNSVVYFNISPLVLILSTVSGYFLYLFLNKILALPSKTAKKCSLNLYALGKSVGLTGIIDTGNSITDVLSNSEIIIVDKAVAVSLLGREDFSKDPIYATRYRTIPCETVMGRSLLEGFRCDMGEIRFEDKVIPLTNPVIALSKTPIKENYSAILNPKILEKQGKTNEIPQKLNM